MATVETSIEAALFARAGALVLLPPMPIAWPNFAFPGKDSSGKEKPTPELYFRVTHLPNVNRRLFLGSSDPHQRLGLLQMDVFVPLDRGASTATEIAGKVAEHFACGTEMWSGSLRVSVTKAPDVARAMPDGTHWMVPVSIQYECFA